MKEAGFVYVPKDISLNDLHVIADMLSAIAADILKGEDKRGKVINIFPGGQP